jgi:hypothetical protein
MQAVADIVPGGRGGAEAPSGASAVASAMLDRADRDIAFVMRFVGESQYLLNRHFQTLIESELAERHVVYGDHPFLRLFVETHARELTEFVLNNVTLKHQFGLQAFERLAGDPMRLLRADLWDTLRSTIESAEAHFVSDLGGLGEILAEVATARSVPPAGPRDV